MSKNRHRRIDDIDLEYADRPRSPGVGMKEAISSGHLFYMPRPREVRLPEPVGVPAVVNGRRLEPWEAGLYVEWAHRERHLELALLAGIGPS